MSCFTTIDCKCQQPNSSVYQDTTKAKLYSTCEYGLIPYTHIIVRFPDVLILFSITLTC